MGNPNEQTPITTNAAGPQAPSVSHEFLQGRTVGLYPEVPSQQAAGYGGTAVGPSQQPNVPQVQPKILYRFRGEAPRYDSS